MKNPNEVVTVCIGELGLKTYIHNWYIREDVDDEESYWEPNMNWFEYRVLREDVYRLISLYTEQLSCKWTPNQEWEEREENGRRIEEIDVEILELERRAEKHLATY